MSLTVDGTWKTGVWSFTIWANGVWREGAFDPGVGASRVIPPLFLLNVGRFRNK